MNRCASSSMRTEEEEEQLYCSGPQDPEGVICDGSDAEHTAEEIAKKRRRYEEIGRRYLHGHRPLIQSASLRGPLSQESGWINPWRSRPRKEADWWQPGSEDMLFTRHNVMKRAADHGLGYLNPTEALAWCKVTAEAETKEQFDSLEVVHHSGELDSGDGREEPSRDGFPPAARTSKDDGPQISHRHFSIADGMKNIDSRDKDTGGLKRPVDSQWLKGMYVSKKARWEDSPLSSPTPVPGLLSERDRRRRQNSSARSAGSGNGQRNPTSQPTTPWPYDAHQRRTISRLSGSTAQGIESKDNGRDFGRQPEDFDELNEDSRETTSISVLKFLSASQGKSKTSKSMGGPFSTLGTDDLAGLSAKKTPFYTLAEDNGASNPMSALESNELPVLPQSPRNQVHGELDENASFITEVVPSSRNLEKFQFRKKRRKSKKHQAKESGEGSRDPLHALRLSSASVRTDTVEDLKTQAAVMIDLVPLLLKSGPSDREEHLHRETSVEIDLTEQLPMDRQEDEVNSGLEKNPRASQLVGTALSPRLARMQMKLPEDELNPGPEKTPYRLQPIEAVLSPQEEPTGMQMEATPSRSRQSDDSYFKRVAMMSVNVLPNLRIISPFALFGSSGASKHTTTTSLAIGHKLTLDISGEIDYGLAFDQIEDATADIPRAFPNPSKPEHCLTVSQISASETPQRASSRLPTTSPKSASKERQRAFFQSSHAAAKYDRSIGPEDHPQAVDESTLDLDILGLLESAARSEPLLNSPMESQATPKTKGHIANLIQESSIDDGSTQSFNSTAPRSLEKPQRSPRFDPLSHRRINPMANRNYTRDYVAEDARLPVEELQTEMEDVQNALSQHCRGSRSSDSSQTDKDPSSQKSVIAAITEPDPRRTTPLAPDDEDRALPAEEEQESWQGCGPQSPWAPENPLQEAIVATTNPCSGTLLTSNQESVAIIYSPSTYAKDEIGSDWQAVERPITPDNDGVIPFEDFISLTPLPQQIEVPSDDENVSNTQQLIEAATNNPWATKSKKRIARKAKKRVSFGDLASEDEPDQELDILTFSKQGPASPPLPRTSDFPHEEDNFNDGTIVSKFRNHFSTARPKRMLPRKNHGLLLNSPAVGAMAERFIAADRETSIEQDRRPGPVESPTRHLTPKSDTMTNLSPETTDYDLEVNLDDFLGDAGDFLGNWSVDSEVRKIKDSKGRREVRRDPSKRRELFGITSGWS
jgi:hypothetical protein